MCSSDLARQPVNLLDMCTHLTHAMSCARHPLLLSAEELGNLKDVCVQRVNRFSSTFIGNRLCTLPLIKMQGFVIGLLYLMRTGLIVCGNIEIVPKVEILALVLPNENQVKTLFGLSTKIMTEVENMIKLALRKITREQLIKMGFQCL